MGEKALRFDQGHTLGWSNDGPAFATVGEAASTTWRNDPATAGYAHSDMDIKEAVRALAGLLRRCCLHLVSSEIARLKDGPSLRTMCNGCRVPGPASCCAESSTRRMDRKGKGNEIEIATSIAMVPLHRSHDI